MTPSLSSSVVRSRAVLFYRKARARLLANSAALALFASPTFGAAVELDPVVLQLKWRHAFQFAGYYAALEQGYFAAAGLDVEIRELTGPKTPVQMLLDGEADYAIGGSELLIHRANGDPLVALAAIYQHSPYAFLVREDSGMTRVENFAGKRVMLGSDSQDAELQATLRRAGLRDGDFVRQLTNYDAFSLLNEDTDVFNAYVIDQGFTLQEAGVRTRYILPQRYGVDFYSDVLATTEQHIEDNPERVRAFREATLRGWEYALANPGELINLILERYNTQGFSYARLEYEARISREMIQPLLVSLGYMNPQRWEHMRQIFVEEGFVDRGSNIDGLIYAGIPQDQFMGAGQGLNVRFVVAGALALLALLAAGVQFHLRRIRHERDRALAARDALRSQQLRVRDLLASLDGFSWEFDLATQRFTYVATRIRTFLGYTDETWDVLDDWLDDIVEEDREYARRFRSIELDAGRDYVCEYRLQRPNGTRLWVMDIVHIARNESGQPVCMCGTVVDVSNLKRAEQHVPGLKESRRKAVG
jgi:PAS domain S-box-containing protein